MMIEDYSVFRDIQLRDMFHADPYNQGFSDQRRGHLLRSPATGLSDNGGRRARSRETIIPILVEGRDFPASSLHIDLTSDITDVNVNNSGLHSRSRNRRRHQVNTAHNSVAGKSDPSVSSPPMSRGAQTTGRAVSRDVSQPSSSELSEDIIDLCMYEDMFDSDVCISESYEENSFSTSKSKSKSSLASKSETNLVELESESRQQKLPSKVVTPTPSYPVYRYLKSELAKDRRLIDYIRGDGNCFFRALSKEIYGSEEFHEDVRQAVVDLIEKYSKEFEQFLDSGISIVEHIKEMRKASTWASSTEIYAAAALLQRDIYVLSPDHTGEAYHWMLFKPRFTYTRDTSYHPCFITLCHTHGNHYDRITPTEGNCNCDCEPPVLSGVHAYVDLTN